MDIIYPQNGYIMGIYYIFMKKVEIDNVAAMIEKKIDPEGRIAGLKQWEGKKAIVLIIEK